MATNTGAKKEMPRYKCHKEVHALLIEKVLGHDDGTSSLSPADKRYGSINVPKSFIDKHNPKAGGYYVVYKDGYASYSPAEAFDNGYTVVMPSKESIMSVSKQIEKLANFIMAEIEGEPSQSEGAADTAIRIIKLLQTKNNKYQVALENLSRLGNEPKLGNSNGNKIAQEALK